MKKTISSSKLNNYLMERISEAKYRREHWELESDRQGDPEFKQQALRLERYFSGVVLAYENVLAFIEE